MRFLLLLLLALSCTITASADESFSGLHQQLEKSRKLSAEFTQKLGTVLKNQIKSGGVASAINVCKQVAPDMAKSYSNETQTVKRVSLKNRNPTLGVPDDWEQSALASFDQAQARGQELATMEKYRFEQESDGTWFRYAKAIPTQAMCLQCHGQLKDIEPEVKVLLEQKYPNDKATGYSLGQIRGAVSIKQKMASK